MKNPQENGLTFQYVILKIELEHIFYKIIIENYDTN